MSKGHLRVCQNVGIQAGVQGEGSRIWEPWLKRGYVGLVGRGNSGWALEGGCPGVLGWVEVDGEEDTPSA